MIGLKKNLVDSFFKYLLKNQNKKIPCHPPAPLSSHLLQSSFPLLSLERETPRVRKRDPVPAREE
jgi:hypothetical protein